MTINIKAHTNMAKDSMNLFLNMSRMKKAVFIAASILAMYFLRFFPADSIPANFISFVVAWMIVLGVPFLVVWGIVKLLKWMWNH